MNGMEEPMQSCEERFCEQVLAEYNSLRAEILIRLQTRHQILALTAALLGIILSFAIAKNDAPLVLLIYPIASAFLAIGWAQHDVRIGEIGRFIALYIEPRLPGLQWEGHLRRDRIKNSSTKRFLLFARYSEVYAAGVLVGSQVAVVAFALLRLEPATGTGILLALDGASIG